MACDLWRDKIAAYADAELPSEEMRAMAGHLRGCASCTADLLGRVQLKRAVANAGNRFTPSIDLRERIQKGLPPKEKSFSPWAWMPKLAVAAAFMAIAFLLFREWPVGRQGQTFAELADLHVATLASANPVDVVSSDRHTVKPWFQGKLPFTFNLPELAGTPFTLEGGRVSYLGQAPGAQLIFRIAKHRISVFIFQDRPAFRFSPGDSRSRRATFNVETWAEQDLRYIFMGDADPSDVHKLSELLKAVTRP